MITSMPSLRRLRVGVDVALVGDDDARLEADEVVAVVPLLARRLERVAAGRDDPDAVEPERVLERVDDAAVERLDDRQLAGSSPGRIVHIRASSLTTSGTASRRRGRPSSSPCRGACSERDGGSLTASTSSRCAGARTGCARASRPPAATCARPCRSSRRRCRSSRRRRPRSCTRPQSCSTPPNQTFTPPSAANIGWKR